MDKSLFEKEGEPWVAIVFRNIPDDATPFKLISFIKDKAKRFDEEIRNNWGKEEIFMK